MLIPVEGQELPTNGSRKLIFFDCSCGKKGVQKPWKYFFNGHTKTCGSCGLLPQSHWESATYGKLRMEDPKDMFRVSGKKVGWICECGKRTVVSVGYVTSGNTSSCGKCDILSASHFAETKYGKLRMKEPKESHRGSNQKVAWVCDCGKETMAAAVHVTRGLIKTCGKCNVLSESHFKQTKYGKLRMRDPAAYHKGSEKIVAWLCDCGHTINTQIGYVTSGDTKSCGDCNLMMASDLAKMEFGRLRMKEPKDTHPGSNQKVVWKCSCGKEVSTGFRNVIKGFTKSCGDCSKDVTEWYSEHRNEIRRLKPPIRQDDLPGNGAFCIIDAVEKTGSPFRSTCSVCGDEFRPMWDNVRLGKALTCGCGLNKTSMAQREICDAVRRLGVEAEMETNIGGLKYDISIPSKKFLIEYNGIRWHSFTGAKERDVRKYENAVAYGYDYLMLFEDEWKRDNERVVNLIRNRLGIGSPRSVRPSKCGIRAADSGTVDPFYQENHYIGPCRGKVHLVAVFDDKIVAAASFARPTRQSPHDWELVRMASNPSYRVHGVWSKLMATFVSKHAPTSIVSFSDNRLFSGKVYEKIGFKYDGEVRPDYYWVRNGIRHHKSGLRKKGEERTSGLTEVQLRTAQGYRKIWDLGKKRWVWRPSP